MSRLMARLGLFLGCTEGQAWTATILVVLVTILLATTMTTVR